MRQANGTESNTQYRRKFLLAAAVPLVLAIAAIAALVLYQSRTFSEREITALEQQLLAAKKDELKNYISIARTAIGPIYGNALPDDEEAKKAVMQNLAAMIYGQDGYWRISTERPSPRRSSNWRGPAAAITGIFGASRRRANRPRW